MKRAVSVLGLVSIFAFILLSTGGTASASPTVTITGCTPSATVVVGNTISCNASVSGSPSGTLSWTTSGAGTFNSTSCTLGASGSCAVSYTPSSTVATTLTASYLGTPSGPFSITVEKASPTVSEFCSPSVVAVGSTATCTLQVNGGAPVGGTTIVFSSQGGTGTISFPGGPTCALSSGACSVAVAATGAGSQTIQATYPGDANDNGPVSATTSLQISKATTTTSVVCSPASVLAGTQTTCTAAVTGYAPSGVVTWSSTDPNGIFSVNPCTLLDASCGVTYTAESSASITASYAGDSNNTASFGTFAITATVSEEIQITVADSAPATSVTLSGCSVTPSTISADGQSHAFQASSGCSGIVVTLPPAGADSRYLTSDGTSSLTIGACSSNSCAVFSATIYYQVENTYSASPQSPAVWSTSGSIQVTGTQLGGTGADVCPIDVTTGSGKFLCTGWTDYATQATMGTLSVSPTQRWATGESSFSDTSGGNVHTSSYYLQVLEYFEYSLVGSTTGPTAPDLDYTAYGAAATLPLAGSSSSVWLDSGSSWKVPVDLIGSTAAERWESQTTSGAAVAGQNVSLAYYHQYYVTFAYKVTGGGTGYTAPTVSFTSFGTPTSGNQSWVDAGSTYGFTNPLSGSTPDERWQSPTATGLVSAGGTLGATYFHQFAFSLNFTVLDGGSYSNPRLTFVALGAAAVEQVNGTRSIFWLDAGTSWSATRLLPSSISTEQWVTDQVTSGTVAAPLAEEFTFYHQYLATLDYSIQGTGGSPPVPSLNYASLGTTRASPLNKTATSVWMDASSTWSVPLTMPGVQGERWLSNVTSSQEAASSFYTDVQYAHQFYVEVGVSTPAAGFVANANQWEDQGSTEVLNATAAHLWELAYWQGATSFSYNGTTLSPTLTVLGPANETAMFYPSLTIFSGNQGSVAYAFGSISGTVAAGSNATVYPPPGRNITLTAQPKTVEIMFSGWSGVLTGTHIQSFLTINAPSQVKAAFATDYTDIRTFAIATIGVFIAAAYVFVIRRGFTPRMTKA